MAKNERDNYLSYHKEAHFLRARKFLLERDLIRIANSIFEQELILKKTKKLDSFVIKISKESYEKYDIKKLSEILEELFLLILLEKVKIKIEHIDDENKRRNKEIVFEKNDKIVLFSGGLDSYSGIKTIENKFGNVFGVFVAHNDQQRIIKIVNSMKFLIKSTITTLYALGMEASGYSQLRGFLYVLSASAIANVANAKEIYVTECGPTMYQPLFSPFDSITYTTHPYVLKAANEIINIFFNNKIKIFLPYENMTKSELIMASGIKDYSMTHSCISQRFGNHDGTCFGCVVRKLACLVSGVKDVSYKVNVFDVNSNQDNLICLLDYSSSIIDNYDEMPKFQTDKIEEFNKKDLFYRYALDNLSGVMLGVKKTHPLYQKYVKNREKILNKRVAVARSKILQPDFERFV